MIDTDKWIASARVSLDELEKEVKRLREQVEYFKGLVDHYKDELLKAKEMSE